MLQSELPPTLVEESLTAESAPTHNVSPHESVPSSPPSPSEPQAPRQSSLGATFFHSNTNVAHTMRFCFFDGGCYSLWGMQLLPVLIEDLTNSTKIVGLSTSICGVAQLIGAIAVGYLSHPHHRQVPIRIGMGCGLVAIVAYLVGLWRWSIWGLMVAQGIWGAYTGITSTSVETLFADSIPSGHRTVLYTWKWMLQTLCYLFGYVAALLMFAAWENQWSPSRVRAVMTAGLLLHPLALLQLQALRDDYVVLDDVIASEVTLSITVEELGGEGGDAREASRCDGSPRCPSDAAAEGIYGGRSLRGLPLSAAPLPLNRSVSILTTLRYWLVEAVVSQAAVPYLICLVDFLMALGSGMTLPFFGLFFVQDYNVKPIGLYVIYILSTVLTAATSSAIPKLSQKYLGRVPAVMLIRLLGTTALLVLSAVPSQSILASLPAVIFLFLLRNALMNSVFGITRSVIMDCVARESRARWSAFESISSFTWAGSALLGGYIVERKSYRFAFTITALLQLGGVALLLPASIGARHLERQLEASTSSL